MNYPSNPHQEHTARERGWYQDRKGVWHKPDNFTKYDQERIERAERRRAQRAAR